MQKLTNKQFLIRLYENNCNFKEGKFEVISEYLGAHSKIRLKDDFGYYNIPANDLLKNTSNPSLKNVENREKFLILKMNALHNHIYKYSPFQYENLKQKIEIVCQKGHIFNQSIGSHLQGKGCPKCAGNILSYNDVVIKANKVHNFKYEYPFQDYKNSSTILLIYCKKHGYFNQVSDYHLSGCGCPNCANEGRKSNKGGYNIETIEREKLTNKKKSCKIYFIKIYNEEEEFYKIGITVEVNLKRRLSNISNHYKKEVLFQKDTNLYDAFYMEKLIIDSNIHNRYFPYFDFSGKTECFTEDSVSSIMELLKSP